MRLFLFLVIIAGLSGGCAGNHNISTLQDGLYNVSKNSKICVVTPQDGRFGSTIYHGSGNIVAEKTVTALKKKFHKIIIIGKASNAGDFEVYRKTGADFAVVPNIIHWEDRVTGWSGKPDVIRISLKAIDLKSKNDSRNIIFENKTNVLASAFVEWGNFQPQSLLDDKFDEAALLLFP